MRCSTGLPRLTPTRASIQSSSTGARGSFIAGADIREFDTSLDPPQTPDLIDAIERLGKPVVAAIAGNALGGGLEVALACDARISADDATLGFPEVLLGLIPGAGGTQRLPRIVGVERALDLIVSGRRIDAREALDLGIVDDLAGPDRLLAVAAQRAREIAAGGDADTCSRSIGRRPERRLFQWLSSLDRRSSAEPGCADSCRAKHRKRARYVVRRCDCR